MVYIKRFWEWLKTPYTKYKEHKEYKELVKKMKEKDPFIYK